MATNAPLVELLVNVHAIADKLRPIYVLLNWAWSFNGQDRVPTSQDIAKAIVELAMSCTDGDSEVSSEVSSGGLTVIRRDGEMICFFTYEPLVHSDVAAE